jgi:hypothetical protein
MPANGPAPDPMPPTAVGGPKLLDQFLDAARTHGQSEQWAEYSADWCRRFILFRGKRHPKEMGPSSATGGFFLLPPAICGHRSRARHTRNGDIHCIVASQVYTL